MQMTFQLDLRTMIEFSLLIAGPFDFQQSIIHTYELDFFVIGLLCIWVGDRPRTNSKYFERENKNYVVFQICEIPI